MPICPKGHNSATDDYCDECGIPIGGSGESGVTGSSGAAGAADVADQATAGQTCPICGAPRIGRFCEEDGYDFVLRPPVTAGPPAPVTAGPSAPVSAGPPAPVSASPPAPVSAVPPAPGFPVPPAPVSAAPPAPVSTASASSTKPVGLAAAPASVSPAPASAPPTTYGHPSTGTAARTRGGSVLSDPRQESSATKPWVAVVTADRDYFETIIAQSGPDAATITFPAVCPERRIQLTGGQVLIGRHSASRGLNPHIDLSGPPEDPGVSRLHAVLQLTTDGGWTITDPGSTNGVTINDDTQPIEVNVPVQLRPGDRIHVGAWTTLTLTQP